MIDVFLELSSGSCIIPLGFLIFRDSKAGMVPSTLGTCRYISHSEIVCRGPKKFENPCITDYIMLIMRLLGFFFPGAFSETMCVYVSTN